jgi:hypothetical protein
VLRLTRQILLRPGRERLHAAAEIDLAVSCRMSPPRAGSSRDRLPRSCTRRT